MEIIFGIPMKECYYCKSKNTNKCGTAPNCFQCKLCNKKYNITIYQEFNVNGILEIIDVWVKDSNFKGYDKRRFTLYFNTNKTIITTSFSKPHKIYINSILDFDMTKVADDKEFDQYIQIYKAFI